MTWIQTRNLRIKLNQTVGFMTSSKTVKGMRVVKQQFRRPQVVWINKDSSEAIVQFRIPCQSRVVPPAQNSRFYRQCMRVRLQLSYLH